MKSSLKFSKQTLFRYIIFTFGLYFLSLGIVCIVNTSLGTTPISSVNYVISLHTPISLGTATFLINILLIALQFLILGRHVTRRDAIEIAMQVPFSFIFSFFIDLNMQMFDGLHITSYPVAICLLVAGCLIQALGVTLEVKPHVVIMSAEGVVKYASQRFHKNFGHMKVAFDITLVTIALLLGIYFSGRVEGIREGTLVAACCTGFLVNFYSRHIFTRENLRRFTAPFRRHAA